MSTEPTISRSLGPDVDDAALFPVRDGDLARLHRRLAEQATDHGLVDVAYRMLDTPIGELMLATTDRGLVRVAFAGEDFDTVLATLAERLGPRILADPRRLDAAAKELEEYFAGTRTAFDLRLDLSLSTGFRREVQGWLPHIGYGHTASYKQVAAQVGRPNAVRAVGTACATNPLPIVVPCHRVLRSDGGLGGYLGGLATKRMLLDLEQAAA